MGNNILNIQHLSEKLDIPKSTLRYWEKELNGIIVPLRSTGGQRRYNHYHIAILKKVKHLRHQGLSMLEIREKLIKKSIPDEKHGELENIEYLADRLAEVVKHEVQQFLSKII